MPKIVVLAGFDRLICDEIRKRPQENFIGSKSNKLVCVDSKKRYQYGKGYVQKIMSKVVNIIEKNPYEKYRLILIYVDYKNLDSEEFLMSFFPFCLPIGMEMFDQSRIEKHKQRTRLVSYLNEISFNTEQGRKKSNKVGDYFNGKNYCSILLPKVNFRSKLLVNKFEYIYRNIEYSDDIRSLLSSAESDILQAHPPKKMKRRSSFIDDAGLIFKSPGGDRHGMSRSLLKPHYASCFIASRIRFGGDFDPAFHFDCELENKRISGEFSDCHGQVLKKRNVSHLNIAPNDFVR